ncbi:MAG: ABC transporter permease subunit [Candidatus Latescibacterota bacterium]
MSQPGEPGPGARPVAGGSGAPAAAAQTAELATAEARAVAASRLLTLGIRETIPVWMAWLLGAVPVVLLLAAWALVTAGASAEERLISPTILPSPGEVLGSFGSLWFERALTRNLFITFGRVLAGFLMAVAVVFPLGVAMGAFTKVKATFTPVSVFGAYLPIPALVPLTLSLFGTGEGQKVVFLALAFGIFLLPQIAAAVEAVEGTYLKTAYTLGASKAQAVLRVLLPVAWPDIYQALRLGFGVGWSYILLAEMVDIGMGLGGIIIGSQRRGPREHIYLVLLVIVAVAFLTDRAWAACGRRLFPYRQDRP